MSVKIECSRREVITSQDIQNDYIKFYPYMMQYLWDLKTVTDLANLEIAIFKRFPDKEEMEDCIEKLEVEIRDTYRDEEDENDKEFQKAFNLLKEDIELYEDTGFEIFQVEEALDVQDVLGEDKFSEHKTLHVGKIVQR